MLASDTKQCANNGHELMVASGQFSVGGSDLLLPSKRFKVCKTCVKLFPLKDYGEGQ